ncbi:hypothetical protein BX070DRAFT_136922 [Coemansia spiralis]|nr:hypothetical protein BX070DRAFT_136922 [Coemansia spiralis]
MYACVWKCYLLREACCFFTIHCLQWNACAGSLARNFGNSFCLPLACRHLARVAQSACPRCLWYPCWHLSALQYIFRLTTGLLNSILNNSSKRTNLAK